MFSGYFFVFRCGSVNVDLVLRFNQSVSESDVISVLKTAAEQKKFTNFDVDPSSIKATGESTQGTVMANLTPSPCLERNVPSRDKELRGKQFLNVFFLINQSISLWSFQQLVVSRAIHDPRQAS